MDRGAEQVNIEGGLELIAAALGGDVGTLLVPVPTQKVLPLADPVRGC